MHLQNTLVLLDIELSGSLSQHFCQSVGHLCFNQIVVIVTLLQNVVDVHDARDASVDDICAIVTSNGCMERAS